MNDSPEPQPENSRDRFLDAALRGLAEGESSLQGEALARIEAELDRVDQETSNPAEPAATEAAVPGRSSRTWWIALSSAAAVVLVLVVMELRDRAGFDDGFLMAGVEMAPDDSRIEVRETLPPSEAAGEKSRDRNASPAIVFSEISGSAPSPDSPSMTAPSPPPVNLPGNSISRVGSDGDGTNGSNVATVPPRQEGKDDPILLTGGPAPAEPAESVVVRPSLAPPIPAPSPVPKPAPTSATSSGMVDAPVLVGGGIDRDATAPFAATPAPVDGFDSGRNSQLANQPSQGQRADESRMLSKLMGTDAAPQEAYKAPASQVGRNPVYFGVGSGNLEADATEFAIGGGGFVPRRKMGPGPVGNERYGKLVDNVFVSPLDEPLSTFSVDVDTASYTNLRRLIQSGAPVPADAVRIEEMINYFSYDYPQPDGKHPFAFALETAACPWNADHQLLRVGIQGKDIDRRKRPDANLVFLLDVSGSMNSEDKLPLVKQSMSLLVEELTEDDCVSIVVYAGAEGLALPATRGSDHAKILRSLDRLKSGGSTNGGAGIQLAYQVAAENFIEDGINRVILCTDGDFNVGKTEDGDLSRMVQRKAKTGVFLSVLGFGTGNINDSMMEKITNEGNGTYYYVDSLREARKVFLQDLMSTLVTIAKDVKIQVEFNPGQVQSYRLIGYANRMLKAEDFENDKVDAGEVGAGHAVTALYEIVPVGVKLGAGDPANPNATPELRYQREKRRPLEIVDNGELATVKLRYKQPDSDTSVPMEEAVLASERKWKKASDDFQFSAAVALLGLQLRGGQYAGEGTPADVIEMAEDGMGTDAFGRRQEFLDLVRALGRQGRE